MRATLLGAVLLALAPASVRAQGLEGWGRVSLMGGWRYTPNAAFYGAAESHGFGAGGGPGGPVALGTFAYSATNLFEVSIDLFAGGERLSFPNVPAYTLLTYGAHLGARVHTLWSRVGPFDRVVPYAGIVGGPTLVYTTGGPSSTTLLPGGGSGTPLEVLTHGWAANVGVTARLRDSIAITLDVRYLLAFGLAPPVGVVNAGGLWAGIGLTWGFPPSEVPRSPSRL